jgi:CubicO group peptidase (beta-lactamase class C family)
MSLLLGVCMTHVRVRARDLLTGAALLLLLTPALQAQPSVWQPVLRELEEKLRADVAADTVGGITAGVVLGGQLVWSTAAGWADRDRRIAADRHTIYRIGSISKSFTAVLLAQLAARGALTLDDPVERYLPEVRALGSARASAGPISLRQLATHTAGIIREPRLQDAARGPIERWEEKVLASIPATSFDTVPGARYAYSNIGFGILGLALSRAARASFMELMTTNIFRPLQLTSTTFIVSDDLKPRLAVGYANSRTGIDAAAPAREHAGRGYKVPNGGIYSTVDDLGRFISALSGVSATALLDERMRAEVMRVQTPEDPRSGYGLGFSVRTLEDDGRIVSHGGSVAGYTAHIAFDPGCAIGVILLRNYGQGQTNLGSTATSVLQRLRATLAENGGCRAARNLEPGNISF